MEIILKANELTVKHHLKRGERYKFTKSTKFESVYIFKKPQIVKGVSSLCADSKHVLFIDYDEVPRNLVEQDYSQIQQLYGLPDAYLLTTGEREEGGEFFGNYHLISLKKFQSNEIREIINKTNADANFMDMPLRKKWRSWILRVGTKRVKDKTKDSPKFIKILTGNGSGAISTAHRKFFEKLYPKLNYSDMKEDLSNEIRFQEYECT